MADMAQIVLARQAAESQALYRALDVSPEKAAAIAIDAIFLAGYNQGIGAAALLTEQSVSPLEQAPPRCR